MTTSVIITAYNLEQYIAEAIQSVIDQTQKADEIIVVDDCSTDNTAAVIATFADAVRYVKMPQNSGGLSATFYGLQQAKMDVVLFLDGDDIWMPEKIESVIPLFEKYPKMGIVSHDYQRVDANRKPYNFVDDTQQNIASILVACQTVEQQSQAFKDSILAKKGYWGGSAYSLRRSYVDIKKFDEWRSSFPHIRNTYLDLVLPTFILVHHPDIMVGYVQKKLFDYRIHATNTSGNKLPGVEAAKKALRMGHCTTQATFGIINQQQEFKAYAQKQQLHIMEYEYLNDVYNNDKLSACKKFFYLSKHLWKRRQIIKELQRLSISVLFGPKIFLQLKSKI